MGAGCLGEWERALEGEVLEEGRNGRYFLAPLNLSRHLTGVLPRKLDVTVHPEQLGHLHLPDTDNLGIIH